MPFADPQRKREYERSRIPRRRAWRRAYSARYRARKRREQVIPPGESRALDALREQLKGKRDAERERIEAAILHLERILLGERVKPRDPRRTELRPVQPIRKRFRMADDGGDPMKPTGRVRGSWMDEKLPPETD